MKHAVGVTKSSFPPFALGTRSHFFVLYFVTKKTKSRSLLKAVILENTIGCAYDFFSFPIHPDLKST